MNARRALLALAAAAAACAAAGEARALTRIEGQYQLIMDLRKTQRFYPWDWLSTADDASSPAELRIFSQPRAGTEAFVKFAAQFNSNNNRGPRPEFQFRDAHLRLRREFGKRGVDAWVFTRQDRLPTYDQYLIPFVYGYGNGTGVRVDAWGILGINTSLAVLDYSDQYDPTQFASGTPSEDSLAKLARPRLLRTDDAYIVRLRRDFLAKGALRLGMTYSRREFNQGDSLRHNRYAIEVGGVTGRWVWRGTDFLLEYGQSSNPEPSVRFASALDREMTILNAPIGISLPDRSVLQAEVRTVKLDLHGIGVLNCIPSYWSRGPHWQNGQGGPGRDETGFNLHTYYLLPERAITYTNNYLRYRSRGTQRREDRENYNELYIEFINGFTGKTYYRQHTTYRYADEVTLVEEHNDWFNEVQVESRLAWLRVQSKVKDIGRPERKQLFAIENSINLTRTLKVYNRFAFGNDASILRKGVFSQFQYRPTGNVEMYLQYGPDYIGGGAVPVEEGNLQGSGDQADIVKFILKGNF